MCKYNKRIKCFAQRELCRFKKRPWYLQNALNSALFDFLIGQAVGPPKGQSVISIILFQEAKSGHWWFKRRSCRRTCHTDNDILEPETWPAKMLFSYFFSVLELVVVISMDYSSGNNVRSATFPTSCI